MYKRYPAVISDANLITIPKMRNIFGTLVGVQITLGTAVSVAACALGADIVEKHVTTKQNQLQILRFQ